MNDSSAKPATSVTVPATMYGLTLPVPVGHVGHARLQRFVGSIIPVSGPLAGCSER